MGITRHSLHKRRSTGGKKVAIHKKRKYDMGRQAANTKLSNEHRTHMVRGRGGHMKFRALRMHTGNFSWGGEGTSPLLCISFLAPAPPPPPPPPLFRCRR
jgi:small subunit ribosomal protein S8e